jgi:hypothetical protein
VRGTDAGASKLWQGSSQHSQCSPLLSLVIQWLESSLKMYTHAHGVTAIVCDALQDLHPPQLRPPLARPWQELGTA